MIGFVSYQDFAARVGVPVGTVKRWAHEGMPVRRMGPRVVVETASALRWVTENRPKAGHREGDVYFARATNGLIKIGFSSDIQRRMAELGTVRLASVPGSIALELALHDAFAEDHEHDEWFRPSPTLLAFIDLLSVEAA